jgi:hypothetical protein
MGDLRLRGRALLLGPTSMVFCTSLQGDGRHTLFEEGSLFLTPFSLLRVAGIKLSLAQLSQAI